MTKRKTLPTPAPLQVPKPWGPYTELMMMRLSPEQLSELKAIHLELHGSRAPIGGTIRRLLAIGLERKRIQMEADKQRQRDGLTGGATAPVAGFP